MSILSNVNVALSNLRLDYGGYLGAVLQYPCKFVIFLLSLDILKIIIYPKIAKAGCYTMT